jgi:hypothetical protein
MFMKIKNGKAFRRAAQAAPKSAEGARKAPCSSLFICNQMSNFKLSILNCGESFLPDLPVLPVNLAFFPLWRRAFGLVVGNLAFKLPDSYVQSPAIITSMITKKIVLDSSDDE